jgi:hypothetical protein
MNQGKSPRLLFFRLQTENGADVKWGLPFVCCKQKMEIADFPHLLQTETDKCNFVFFRRQTIKRLSTIAVSAICPSMVLRHLFPGLT